MNALLLAMALSLSGACDNCNFIRGDANCDGSVNITDVINIANGVFSNADAADANDDGHVDISDSVYLSHHLFQGSAAPPCPYPSSGLDCTADSLENCCSPPTTKATTPLPARGNLHLGTPGGWDMETLIWQSQANGVDKAKLKIKNVSDCDHETAMTIEAIGWELTDAQGYTKKRIQNSVQHAFLRLRGTLTFLRGAVCQDLYCQYSNELAFDVQDIPINIYAGPKVGPATANRTLDWTQHESMTYTRSKSGNVCVCTSQISKTVNIDLLYNIDDELESMATGDCTEMAMKNVTIGNMDFLFLYDNWDITDVEEIDLDLAAEVSYGWCTCQ